MPRTIPAPAMPLGAKFDPEETLINNASSAWEHEKARRRHQGERNARVLARRVFKTDDLDFLYDVRIGLDVPTFVVEGELILFNGESFALVEYCGDCGKEPRGKKFSSLAGLGRAIEERDEEDAYLCRMCQLAASSKRGK